MVTGASRGIGAACAKALAQAGFDLLLTCRTAERELKALASALSAQYRIECGTFVGDLKDPAVCERLFCNVRDLDVLVSNAGLSQVNLITEETPEAWREIMGVNLDAPFYCARLAIPYFLAKHEGRIIHISSVWGEVGASMETAYSASKGGLNAFTRALARELAPSGIAVNAISCGMIDTEMNSHLTEEEKREIIRQIPADRLGKPEEVASLVRYLAEAIPYLTGQVIRIDGGWI